MPRLRRPGRADDLRSCRSVQGVGLVRHRLRQEIFVPGSVRRRRFLLERERQEGRKIEGGWLLERFLIERELQRKLIEGIFFQGELVEGEFVEGGLVEGKFFQGKPAQSFRKTQIA